MVNERDLQRTVVQLVETLLNQHLKAHEAAELAQLGVMLDCLRIAAETAHKAVLHPYCGVGGDEDGDNIDYWIESAKKALKPRKEELP